MYKVVLVEDEPLILEGLRLTGPWPAFDCQVVGEATDALEAEAVIRRLRPDIVITDIHMPGISGLQLIERLRGSVPCEWIILSGYDQFEYARKAVNLGVKGYLLKPVDDEELKEVLRSTLDSLRRRQGEAAPATGVIAQDSGVGERYLARAKVLMEKRCAEELTLHGVAAPTGHQRKLSGQAVQKQRRPHLFGTADPLPHEKGRAAVAGDGQKGLRDRRVDRLPRRQVFQRRLSQGGGLQAAGTQRRLLPGRRPPAQPPGVKACGAPPHAGLFAFCNRPPPGPQDPGGVFCVAF